jgi:glycosyltransferase involved in cell wall biosynthesis
MRVLVVDEGLPHPTDSGKRIRTFELLRRLAGEFETTLAFHQESPPPAASLGAMREAGISLLAVLRRPLEKSGPRFAWDLFRNLFLRAPYMVMAHRTRSMRHAVAAFVEREKPGLVHVEWTPLLANVPKGLGVPVAVAAHNVESDIWDRYRENERSLPRRAYVALQARKVRRFEGRALAAADLVTAVSERDAERIRAWTGQPRVVVVPNGVDASAFAPLPGATVAPGELLFTGSLDWRPNQDAVVWMLEEVLPRIRARRADARFSVVGRRPPEWLVRKAAAAHGAAVHGSVPDVRPYVARAALSVVPLRIGGGSRLKILEALAMGRPVVSTTVGAEGLDLGDGLVIADGAEGFAAAVLEALEDPAGSAERAERGRARVLERYEWSRIAPLQARAWREAAARGARPS